MRCKRNTPPWGWTAYNHLLKREFGCSRKRVHRQMRLAGVSSARRRACKAATNSNHSHPIAPNLLMRSFTFQRPDQAWGGYHLHTHRRRLALSGNRKRPVYQEDCGVRILRACLRSLGGSTRSWRLRPWKWHTAAASLQKAVSHQVRGAVRCVCPFGVFLQYPLPSLRSGLDSSLSF